MRLQGKGKLGHHGNIWEALPSLEALLRVAEEGRQQAQEPLEADDEAPPAERTRHRRNRAFNTQEAQPLSPIALQIAICWQNAWEVLRKYNKKTDEAFEIFAAATLLNPSFRRGFFDTCWTETSQRFINPMLVNVRKHWEQEYMGNQPPPPPPREYRSIVDAIGLETRQAQAITSNEALFEAYLYAPGEGYDDWRDHSIFEWWNTHFSALRQWAFDTLSVPAMSAECERIFSATRRTITQDRSSLSNEMVEALTCLHHWVDNELICI